MNDRTSITALMAAFGRAYHANTSENPVFADTMAAKLMTPEEYRQIGDYIVSGIDFFAPDKKGSFPDKDAALQYLVNTQIAPTPLARAKFCEDSLKTALRTGTRQYVMLGAGMDSFALREPEMVENCLIFEVDHPATQADKKQRIERAGLAMPENLHFVPVDFAKDNLAKKLLAAGFDPCKKTFFSWLGVSYYLTLPQIEGMLQALAAISAQGSSLVFDYADAWLFDSKVHRVQNMLAMAKAGGEPMVSCFDEPTLTRLLEKHGFLLYELLSPLEIGQYFAGRADGLTAFEHIHYAHAVYRRS